MPRLPLAMALSLPLLTLACAPPASPTAASPAAPAAAAPQQAAAAPAQTDPAAPACLANPDYATRPASRSGRTSEWVARPNGRSCHWAVTRT